VVHQVLQDLWNTGNQGDKAERIDSSALGHTRKIVAAKMAITTSILLNIKTGLSRRLLILYLITMAVRIISLMMTRMATIKRVLSDITSQNKISQVYLSNLDVG
jgi:hypothetical protein